MKLPFLLHPLLICGALLGPVSSVSAQNTLFLDRVIAQEDVVLTSDVWYGEGEEEPDVAGTFYLDIYRASNLTLPDKLPTIIYLHGGNGDKEAQPAPSYCYEFARRGYVAIAVQYRVGNVITAAGDVANAIRWVRENAARYKVDTDRILVGGHSFGGVTSAELTANQSDYFGPDEGGMAATLLCAAALNQFPVNASEISLEGPPIMIVHGRDDPIATVNGVRSLVTDLDRLTDPVNGIRYPYSYLEVAGAGHAFYPGTGSGITLPFIAGPIDADQGWSNTAIAGKAVADHVFEFFFEHLNLAGILAQSPLVLERNSGMSVDDMSYLMSIKHDNRITYQVHSSPDLMIWTPATSEPELNGEFLEVALPLVPPRMFHRWSLHFDYGEQRSLIEDDGGNGDDELLVTEDGIVYVRTPESFFRDLPDWPYEYRYVEIDGLRQAYAEAGPSDGPVVLLLHGQPTWSYLYRKIIPVLAEAGYRVIAMDHLGMGRSDKPIDIDDYTYLGHNDRLEKFIQALALQDINLFVQDWGSLIGLRVAGLNPEWFASIAVGNGALPVWPVGTEVHPVVENPNEILDIPAPYALIPDQQPLFYNGCQRLFPFSPDGFADWMEYAMKSSQFVPSGTVEAQTWFPISAAVEAAYDAPFPSRLYMAGTRKFPSLVNEVPGTTDEAWVGLSNFTRPFVTIWASNDIGEMGSCEAAQIFIDRVPGAAGQPHVRLPESSHFLQDDQGEEIARRLVEFYLLNGIAPVTVDPLDRGDGHRAGLYDTAFPTDRADLNGGKSGL